MASTRETLDDALLCVGRRKGIIEAYTPQSLQTCAQTCLQDSDPVYLSTMQQICTQRLPNVLTVTEDGHFYVLRFQRKCENVLSTDSVRRPTKLKTIRRIKAAEHITTAVNRFLTVHATECICDQELSENGRSVLFGGENVNVSVCDLEDRILTFSSKPPRNPYQLTKRDWVTACTFLPRSEGNLIFGGNAERELFLYDIRAKRRPVFVTENWRDSRVTCVRAELNGTEVWVANAMGYVDRFDLRKRAIRGTLTGQVAGSIRSLKLFEFASRSLIASVGLDRFLRVYSTEHRQLQTKCYCKYPLTAIEILPGPSIDDDSSDEQDTQEQPSISEEAVSKRRRVTTSTIS